MNKRMNKQREAGDLRRHRGHYEIIVMVNANLCSLIKTSSCPIKGLIEIDKQ